MKRPKNTEGLPKVCAKCGKEYTYKGSLDFHHFLPSAKWYYEGDGVYLCKECHNKYHELVRPHYRGTELKDKEWYYSTFIKWLIGATIVSLILWKLW